MKKIKNFKEFVDSNKKQEPLLEMARVGFISQSPVFEIYVHTDDPGNIPHFHIRDYKKDGESGKGFHTCIEYRTNRYFQHNGNEYVLNSDLRKTLCDFLKRTEEDEVESNWNILVKEWNRNNPNAKIPTNLPMPDYMTIE